MMVASTTVTATTNVLVVVPLIVLITTTLAMACHLLLTAHITGSSFAALETDKTLTENVTSAYLSSRVDFYSSLSIVCRPTLNCDGCCFIYPHSNDDASCNYRFEEWMTASSTGLVVCVLVLLYGLLVAVIHSIACYKFIATWYLITGSLREQQNYTTLRCIGNGSGPGHTGHGSVRRRTCREALIVRPYRPQSNPETHATLTPSKDDWIKIQVTCPVCLMELQAEEMVTFCDGCTATFHKDCLFDWLEYKSEASNSFGFGSRGCQGSHTSCPCCRKEMLDLVTPPNSAQNGWLSDMSTYMGYYTR